MSGEQTGDSSEPHQEADFAQAFKDLARGERAASAMENHLDALERKIEELLAKANEDEKNMKAHSKPNSSETKAESKDS